MVYKAMEKETYLFNALLYHIYLNNFILLVLLEMNSSIIRSYSIFSNNSLSSDIWAKSVSLCCNIVERKYDFNSFNLEKLRSADATVTGMVNRTLYAILALGKRIMSLFVTKFIFSRSIGRRHDVKVPYDLITLIPK